jgi:hypothetical protein
MDVISSGLEACPWGLNGYGFDQYISGSPGNAVMALARYWHDGASEIAAVEERYPERCHRVRYEDMVRDPERVAAGIFEFIGVGQAPGVAVEVFARDHERFGPADHKIWNTDKITAGSVGRSDAVPVGLIPPPVLDSINGLLGQLGYVTVDETWGTAGMPAGLLALAGVAVAPEDDAPESLEPGARVVAERLASGLAEVDDSFAERWADRVAESFTVVVREPGGSARAAWRVDLGGRVVLGEDGLGADGPDEAMDADWGLVGSPRAWAEVLAGRLNLSVSLRANELRDCDFGENDTFVTEDRIALLAAFLGLPRWSDKPGGPRELVPAVSGR